MPLWPIHIEPNKDELLSSWLTRIATAFSVTTSNFCSFTFPDFKITLKEIDRIYSEEMMTSIAEGAEVSLDLVWQASILSDEGYAFTLRGGGSSDWIFPALGISGKKSKGLAYCPHCLASDKEPYYRKSWRYIFNPVCPEHRVLLQQGCPRCGEPYSYYNPYDEVVRNEPFTICLNCGSDIREAKSPETSPELISMVLEVQTKLNEGFSIDSFDVPGYGQVHAQSYFNVLHGLMYSLTDPELAKWTSIQYQSELPAGFSNTERDLSFSVNAIEELPTDDIAKLLCLGSIIMRDWPNRFIELTARRYFPHLSKFHATNVPYWVVVTASEHLRSNRYATSKEEINSAKNVLQAKLGRKATQKELTTFMADGIAKSSYKFNQIDHAPPRVNFGKQKRRRPRKQMAPDQIRKLINLSAEDIQKGYALTKPAQNKNVDLGWLTKDHWSSRDDEE